MAWCQAVFGLLADGWLAGYVTSVNNAISSDHEDGLQLAATLTTALL
jgi:hypothetical protein